MTYLTCITYMAYIKYNYLTWVLYKEEQKRKKTKIKNVVVNDVIFLYYYWLGGPSLGCPRFVYFPLLFI